MIISMRMSTRKVISFTMMSAMTFTMSNAMMSSSEKSSAGPTAHGVAADYERVLGRVEREVVLVSPQQFLCPT